MELNPLPPHINRNSRNLMSRQKVGEVRVVVRCEVRVAVRCEVRVVVRCEVRVVVRVLKCYSTHINFM